MAPQGFVISGHVPEYISDQPELRRPRTLRPQFPPNAKAGHLRSGSVLRPETNEILITYDPGSC